MNDFSSWLVSRDHPQVPLDLGALLIALGLAFLGGQLLAWIYHFSHGRAASARSLMNAIVVMPVLVALMMLILQDNLITAFGIMGIFALVRFRNVLTETHDATYVFGAIMIGVATGTQRFSLALVGGTVTALILIYLGWSGVGRKETHDLVIQMQWGRSVGELDALRGVILRYGRNLECTSLRARESGGCDVAYLVLLRDSAKLEALLAELGALEGVQRLNSFRADKASRV